LVGLRITTWNVNGLRAALGKGILEWIEAQPPDVLCLQEVRANPAQIDAEYLNRLAAIYPFITWNPADRPGYSGVAVLARTPPLEVHLGLDIPEFDCEGRVICYRYPGFRLFNIYFPHGGHDLSRVPFKLDFYARWLEVCEALHASGERVILCGDFNTAHRPIDLRNPKANEQNSGFLLEERVWIDNYLSRGLVDIFRYLYPDKVQYTWWTYRLNARARNVGWRLDFFLVSQALVSQVQEALIDDQVTGSDHCPVTLIVKN
jgi:exodeoxyribonuclease-3